ncbi:unnamed protein product [Eretmochelys imbricata]
MVAWLNLANTFGSMPHHHIFAMLQEFGMPENFLRVIREVYEGCSTTSRSVEGETAEIPIRVKQGCPLSPIIFILAMEPLLRAISNGTGGFNLHEESVSVLAYADDLVLTVDNPESLQGMLDSTSRAANWMGLPLQCKEVRNPPHRQQQKGLGADNGVPDPGRARHPPGRGAGVPAPRHTDGFPCPADTPRHHPGDLAGHRQDRRLPASTVAEDKRPEHLPDPPHLVRPKGIRHGKGTPQQGRQDCPAAGEEVAVPSPESQQRAGLHRPQAERCQHPPHG